MNALVAGAAEGDELAVKKLLAVVVPAIVPYCRTQLGTDNAADIVVHDSCRAIIEMLPGYRLGDESFGSYVNNVVAHKVSDAQSSVMGMGADSVALSIDPFWMPL